jgi:hypothetical protein
VIEGAAEQGYSCPITDKYRFAEREVQAVNPEHGILICGGEIPWVTGKSKLQVYVNNMAQSTNGLQVLTSIGF